MTEHRSKTDPPTKPGYYYARMKGSAVLKAYPVLLSYHSDGTLMVYWEDGDYQPMSDFDFYGPVNDVIPL